MVKRSYLLLLACAFLFASCVSSEKKPPGLKDAGRCVIAPENWAVDEVKNELVGTIQKRKYTHYEGKSIDYIVLKLDQPICVVGYLKNDQKFHIEGIDEIQLRLGSVDFKDLAKEEKRVIVRGNLIHVSNRNPGDTFTEVFYSVKSVTPIR